MRLSVHARWQADLLTPDSFPLVWKDLELARDLGAVLLNVHLFHEQGMATFVDSIIPLIRRTAESGLQLAIENTPHHSPEQFNDVFAHLHALGSRESIHVGMCLDVGHANLCSATRNNYLEFCDRLDPRVPIIHLHLHENWGDADTHLPIFTGPAASDDSGIRGLLARLRQRNFSGSIILEQWPHPRPAEQRARPVAPAVGGQRKRAGEQCWHSSAIPDRQIRPNAQVEDLAAELVAGTGVAEAGGRSWILCVVCWCAKKPALTTDQLIDIAIYLRFLGTGEIACGEDGRHFRPAHHARIASKSRSDWPG